MPIPLDHSGAGKITLKAPTSGTTTYTLPSADGTSGQLLSTNGSGVMSWATPSGGSTGFNTVGSYAFAYSQNAAGFPSGTTASAGASGVRSTTLSSVNTNNLSGTWRWMGGPIPACGCGFAGARGVWARIA